MCVCLNVVTPNMNDRIDRWMMDLNIIEALKICLTISYSLLTSKYIIYLLTADRFKKKKKKSRVC